MRFFCCTECQTCWQLGGDFKEIQHIINSLDFEKGTYPCITPLCNGRLMKVHGTPPRFQPKEIPVRAFYRAIHGFGAGAGKEASIERFIELLRTKKIVEVQASPVGQPERVILNQLVLEDGTRLHFDSSTRGACCYYIEERGQSCVEVFDELSTDATAESSKQDRKEVGRTVEVDAEADTGRPAVLHAADEQSGAGGVSSVPETDHVQARAHSGDGSTGVD